MAYATPIDLASFALSPAFLSPISVTDQTTSLGAASDIADGYLAQHFTLPLIAPYPIDLKIRVCEIAAYYLAARRGYSADAVADVSIKDRYDNAIKWLEKIARGEITPKFSDSSQGAIVGGAFVTTSTQRGYSNRGNAALDPTPGPFEGD